jgi:TetR/AcrR family transcriptional repressor of nem operon
MEQAETQLTPRGAATRTRIVDAAAGLVRRNGAAGTSLEAVMLAAGVSKSQLYHYFADKEALITAVVERQTERVLGVNGPLLKDVNSIEGLRHWRDVLLDGSAADGCPLGSLVGELAERPRQRAALAEGFARWQSYLRDGFARMRDRGELAPTAPLDDLAVACLAALQGGLLLAQAERSSRPLRLALDMAIAQVAAAGTAPQAPR